MTRFEALKQVAGCFPTQEAMADAFGVTQPTVWRWLNQSRQLPAEQVLTAERLTGVSRHDIRPDIYPRDEMVDHGTADRFVGIDLRARTGEGRQSMRAV